MVGRGTILLTALLLAIPAAATGHDALAAADTGSSVLALLRTPVLTPPFLIADATSPAALADVSPPLAATGFDDFDDTDRDVVSARRAAAYSLILPGAGQWYAGDRRQAGFFLAADAVAWGVWGYFRTVGAVKKEDHRNYAAVHAGVNPEGKDDGFYRTITFYESRDYYNENRFELNPAYPGTEDWNWQWDSPQSQTRYRDMRNQSNEAYNRAKFALGAAVLTRIVAAIDAWRIARLVNRSARMEMARWKVRFKAKPSLEHPSLMVILSKRF